MIKFLISGLVLMLVLGCAYTGMDVYKHKTDNIGTDSYYTSLISINSTVSDSIDKIELSLQYEEYVNIQSWYIAITCPRLEHSSSLKPKLMFLIDDDLIEYENFFISESDNEMAKNDYTCEVYNFIIKEELYKKIMFAKETSLLITCKGKKFEGVLTSENINDFGIFYNYVRRNIIENKTVIIK